MAPSPPRQLNLADLKALSVLGQGARGVVFHVVPVAAAACCSTSGDPMNMALKSMSRAAARRKGAGEGPGLGGGGDGHRRIWFERDVLLALRHPLLPFLRGVVATDAVVGFAIDRCPGGDLKSLRRRWWAETEFPDSVIRFYAAELVLALEHLHGLGIVYRDLKPENVLIQESGHIMLVDFDLSTTLPPPPPPPPPPPDATPPRASSPSPSSRQRHRKRKNKKAAMFFACFSSRHAASLESSSQSPLSTSGTASSASSSSCCSSGSRTPAKSNSFVGTEDYVAPEIVAGCGHNYAVDWWGLGVVLYEMQYGRTPFRGRSRRETFHRILTAAPELPGEPTPLRDLIARLLEKDPGKRLGAHGVKRHAFFRGVDWDSVLDVARPPFIPAPDDDDDAGAEAGALDVEKVVHEAFASSGAGETPPEEDVTTIGLLPRCGTLTVAASSMAPLLCA
ncbi:serine/threonine-protein kinase OXI1-like isoform X2 [Phragmites australis]|uniref:serine/threonine-protein kinase OXI1-like isoform X2 n=1 Tax=Phragmites australis TaxID=29695 RepID=UPI002D790683|nr:serine/threonine-protein kinase OXI1-like isoform X2 [Phragmites australis]